MTEKIEIKTLEMVRQIRDQHKAILDGKSRKEIIDFFCKKALEARTGAISGRSDTR